MEPLRTERALGVGSAKLKSRYKRAPNQTTLGEERNPASGNILPKGCDIDKWHLCRTVFVVVVFYIKIYPFFMVNHWTHTLGDLHSTGETIVWRDPGGS